MSAVARTLCVSRTSLYAEPTGRGPQQRVGDNELLERIKAIVEKKPTFGYRRVTARLRRRGVAVNHKRIYRLMSRHGLLIRNTPAYSPESNGMAEAFVKTFKRDFVYLADVRDAEAVMKKLPGWFEEYNEDHPHKGLKMLTPREFRRANLN